MPRSPKSRPHPRTDLSKLEMEVMDEIWRLGECSSNDVIEAFGKRRPLAPTTIRTVVTKLKAKGYLEAVPTIERAMRLRPVVARDSVLRRTLDRLRDSLFGGSPRAAIAHLLDSEKISEAELTELRQLIDSRRARRKS